MTSLIHSHNWESRKFFLTGHFINAFSPPPSAKWSKERLQIQKPLPILTDLSTKKKNFFLQLPLADLLFSYSYPFFYILFFFIHYPKNGEDRLMIFIHPLVLGQLVFDLVKPIWREQVERSDQVGFGRSGKVVRIPRTVGLQTDADWPTRTD